MLGKAKNTYKVTTPRLFVRKRDIVDKDGRERQHNSIVGRNLKNIAEEGRK